MPTGIYKRTEIHRQALRVSRKGSGIYKRKPFITEHKKNISKALFKVFNSSELRKKLSEIVWVNFTRHFARHRT